MNSNPLVSVVLASYNMGHYLPESVRSVLAQTYENIEVIIIDDGSTDDTEEQIKPLLSDPRLRYIKQENQGQPKAKNNGIKACNGEYIAFCDGDDLWATNKLELQLPLIDHDPEVGVVYSEVSYIDDKGNPLDKEQPYERYSGMVTDKLILKNFIPFGTALVKRQCFNELGLFDENLPMGIDWDLWLRFSVRFKIKYLADKTYIYRIWPGQMSSNYRGRYHHAELIMKKFIENNPRVLPEKVVNSAWADTFNNKGMAIARAEKTIKEPLSNIFTALRYDFQYIPAWKSLIKILIRKTR
jgi:glycosyltransferase involved in cell wall biosynthesis